LLTLREKRRLRMFKNRLLRKIFGPKGVAVTVNWKRLHNGKIYDLFSSPNIIRVIESRRMRGEGSAPRMVERRGEERKGERRWENLKGKVTWKT
jgi:hypothetical protein